MKIIVSDVDGPIRGQIGKLLAQYHSEVVPQPGETFRVHSHIRVVADRSWALDADGTIHCYVRVK